MPVATLRACVILTGVHVSTVLSLLSLVIKMSLHVLVGHVSRDRQHTHSQACEFAVVTGQCTGNCIRRIRQNNSHRCIGWNMQIHFLAHGLICDTVRENVTKLRKHCYYVVKM
jgi:hypothetical protein